MIVRCGRCGQEFDASSSGRHQCPACGTFNEVRLPGDVEATPPVAPAPPPAPEAPAPRVECGECGHSFIVGAIAEAPCPNCGNTVTVPDTES